MTDETTSNPTQDNGEYWLAGTVLYDSSDGECFAIQVAETEDEPGAQCVGNDAAQENWRCLWRSTLRDGLSRKLATPEQAAALFEFWASQSFEPDFFVQGYAEWKAAKRQPQAILATPANDPELEKLAAQGPGPAVLPAEPFCLKPGMVALASDFHNNRGDLAQNRHRVLAISHTYDCPGRMNGLNYKGEQEWWGFSNIREELATPEEREQFFHDWLENKVEPDFFVDGWEEFKLAHAAKKASSEPLESETLGAPVRTYPPVGSVLYDTRDGEIVAIRELETETEYAKGVGDGAGDGDFRVRRHICSSASWMKWATPEQKAKLFAFWRSQNWQPDFPVDGWVQWVAEQRTRTGQEPPKNDLAAVGLQALRDLGKAVEDANMTFAAGFAKERKKRLKLAKRVKKLEQTLNDRDLSVRLTALESLLKGAKTDDPAFKLTGIKIVRETAQADPDAKLSFEQAPSEEIPACDQAMETDFETIREEARMIQALLSVEAPVGVSVKAQQSFVNLLAAANRIWRERNALKTWKEAIQAESAKAGDSKRLSGLQRHSLVGMLLAFANRQAERSVDAQVTRK